MDVMIDGDCTSNGGGGLQAAISRSKSMMYSRPTTRRALRSAAHTGLATPEARYAMPLAACEIGTVNGEGEGKG